MTAFKNALFDSEELVDNHLLPVEEWERIRKYATHQTLDKLNEAILAEIKPRNGGLVDLQKLMDILDLYTLLPMSKKRNNNGSTDIYWVMTSNTKAGYTTK